MFSLNRRAQAIRHTLAALLLTGVMAAALWLPFRPLSQATTAWLPFRQSTQTIATFWLPFRQLSGANLIQWLPF
jgi:hypothetical protein